MTQQAQPVGPTTTPDVPAPRTAPADETFAGHTAARNPVGWGPPAPAPAPAPGAAPTPTGWSGPQYYAPPPPPPYGAPQPYAPQPHTAPMPPAGYLAPPAPARSGGRGKLIAIIAVVCVIVLGSITALVVVMSGVSSSAAPASTPSVAAPAAPAAPAADPVATRRATAQAFSAAGVRIDQAQQTFKQRMTAISQNPDLGAFQAASRDFGRELVAYRSAVSGLPMPAEQQATFNQVLMPNLDATIADVNAMSSASSANQLQNSTAAFAQHWVATANAHDQINHAL